MCVCVEHVVVIVIIIARVHYYTLAEEIFQRKRKPKKGVPNDESSVRKKKLAVTHVIDRILLVILRIRRIRGVDDRSGNVVVIRDA